MSNKNRRLISKNKKQDWIIHAVYDPDNPEKPIDYHTHGLEKYGLKNLCMEVEGKEYSNACARIINRIAKDMVEGEVFKPDMRHYVDDGKDKLYDVFDLYEVTNKEGEELLLIEYLFYEMYVLPTNCRVYVFNPVSEKWIKVEEIAWEMFGDEPQNGRDIIHIDGDLTNNAIDNLKLA